MRIKRLALLFLICSIPAISHGSIESPPVSDNRLINSNISYDPATHKVAIKASKVRLDELTKQFSAATGIDFVFIEPVLYEVTLDAGPLPVEDALTELLRNQNYIVVKNDSRTRISKILVLPRGEQAGNRYNTIPGNTAAIIDPVEHINEIIANAPVQASRPVPEEARELISAIAASEFDRMIAAMPETGDIRDAFESTREHWMHGLDTGYYRISPDALRDDKSLSGFLGLPETDLQK